MAAGGPGPGAGEGAAERGPWAAIALALVAAAAVAALWSVDYLPTHDGPQHIFTIHAANHLDDPARGYGRFVEPRLPLSNHGFALLFGPLDLVLPWRTATRLALTGLLLVWCAGAFALARSLHPRRAWLGVALAGGAFQWSLWMGLFSFHLSSGFGLLVLAAALAPRTLSRGRRVALALLLFAQALLHLVPAALTGAVLLALALSRARRGERLRAWWRTAALGAPAAAVVAGVVLLSGLGRREQAHAGDAAGWVAERPPLWTLAGCFFAGPDWRAWPPTLLAVAAPLAALLAALGRRALRRRTPSPPRSAEDRALLLAGSALVLAAALTPLHLRAWDFFSVRFLPLGVACLLVAWPVERLGPGPRRSLAAGLTAFALASCTWAGVYNRDLAARAADALAGLDAPLVRDGPLLPIVLDPYLGPPTRRRTAPVPYAVPLLNLGQLYATAQGGFPPYTFSLTGTLHPVVWREEARRRYPPIVDRRYALDLARRRDRDDRGLREAVIAYLAAVGTHYQDIVLWGRPADADRVEQLGFVPEFRRGGLLVARFRGCPLALRFPAGAPPPGTTRVELGWLPAWHVTHRYRLDPADPRFLDASGHLVFPLAKPPCGGAWLRLASETGEPLVCEGADAEGRLLVASTRATPVVDCRLPGA